MKKIVAIVFIFCLAGIYHARDSATAEGESAPGKPVFEQRNCAVCHHPTDDQRRDGLGPSWKQIAQAYQGHDDDLTKFLKGTGKPLVDKTNFPMMHGQIILLNTCAVSEVEALEQYLKQEVLNPHLK